MIKLFFSHVCADATDQLHSLLAWVTEKIKKDLRQFEPFVACRNGDWNNARELNNHLDQSPFFIPVITDSYLQRQNCTAELARARDRRNSPEGFPVILPLKLGCNGHTMQGLGFQIDMQTSQGEIWIDFSESETWETGYATLCERLISTAIKHRLLGDEDFYKDCEHLDLILKRDKPTAYEIKAAVDLCRMGEEYGQYFFGKLDRKEWIYHLRPRRFFNANPVPVQSEKQTGFYSIPFWPVLGYLERISKDCEKPENRSYAEDIMRIIRDVTKPKDRERADNFRTWAVFSKIMANLPTDVIDIDDIGLIGEWLENRFDTTLVGAELGQSLMPKLLRSDQASDWEKAAKLVEVVTRIRWTENSSALSASEKEPRTAIDDYWLNELFRKNNKGLGERCGRTVVATLRARLEEVLAPEREDQYSYIWRPAVEDHGQNVGGDNVRAVLISALRDVLLSYAVVGGNEIKEVLREFLGDQLNVVKRIALHLISQRYAENRELFWEIVGPGLFNNPNLHHELFELLQGRFQEFSPDEQGQIIQLIDGLTENWRQEANQIDLDQRLRLRWLEAIRGHGNAKADERYQKYLGLVQRTPEHPEFVSYTETIVGEGKPCTAAELLAKSIPEIVQYLNEFKGTGKWKTPTEQGLADALREAVKEAPQKFEGELPQFLNVSLHYQSAILRAFEDRWEARQPIDWAQVLSFCWAIVEPDALWQQTDESKDFLAPTHGSITSVISNLIERGVQSDEWAFDEVHLPLAEKILLRILQKERPTSKGEKENALTEAMNTPRGRGLMAFLNYALRQTRVADDRAKGHLAFWTQIRPVFDRELDRCQDANFEFSALAGAHLPNLLYLSKDWTENNVDRIFSTSHERNWRCAIHGYAAVGRVYQQIYVLLKDRGHLERALGLELGNSHVREKLIQTIAVAYLSGWEGLDDAGSLFAKVLQTWRQEDIREITSLFWMSRDAQIGEEGRAAILKFWKRCYERIHGQEEKHTGILSDLNLLAVFMNEISDEQKSWLLQSAPFVDENHHSPFLLEYLRQLTPQNPAAVADVYLAMLSSKVMPTYKEDDIRSIVEQIYEAGIRDKANAICDAYARGGSWQLLQDLRERYGRL